MTSFVENYEELKKIPDLELSVKQTSSGLDHVKEELDELRSENPKSIYNFYSHKIKPASAHDFEVLQHKDRKIKQERREGSARSLKQVLC